MTGPHDRRGRRRNPQSPPSPQRPQRPQRPQNQPPRQGRHERVDRPERPAAGNQPPAARRPPERRPRPPAAGLGHDGGPPRRRRSPNAGVYPDEHPTDIVNVDYDALFGDEDPDAGGPAAARSPGGDRGGRDRGQRRPRRDSARGGRERPQADEHALPEYFEDGHDQSVERSRRRAGKRFLGWMAALVVLVVLAGGAFYGARELFGFGFEDYEGKGKNDVVLEVADGDSTGAIANKLEKLDVVASSDAFVAAAEGDDRVLGIQPGFYTMKTKMSGANAVARLVDEGSRVGELQLRAGLQLDDVQQPGGSVTEGVITRLSKASCAELDGKSTCVPREELWRVATSANLADLGVPEWAVEPANKAGSKRRLEGLISPGLYDVKPGWNATRLLTELLTTSTIRMQAAGLPDAAKATGLTPYEVLIVASIVEREGVENDFGKVARVIYNRLAKGMPLQMDSTVNYVLHKPDIRTTTRDHAKAGAYNSYGNDGLVPTPISAPSTEALNAALQPPQGDWLYFVKCEKNGLSCFATNFEDHQRNIDDAKRRGVF